MALVEYRFNESYGDRSSRVLSSERKLKDEKVPVSGDEIIQSSHTVIEGADTSIDGNDDKEFNNM
jgi:hypothetical protein